MGGCPRSSTVIRRVTLIVSVLDGSGPGRVMGILAQGLLERGVDVSLIATHGPEESNWISELKFAGVPVFNLGMRSLFDPAGGARLLRHLRSWNPEVVHTRTIRADLLGRLASRYDVPVVNNIVNIYPDDSLTRQGPVLGRAVMQVAKLSRGAVRLFVANARAVASNVHYAFGIPLNRVQVVYDGLPMAQWCSREPAALDSYGIGRDDLVCLTVARLHPQKGLDDLVTAARRVADRRSDVKFVIAGSGPSRGNLESRIRSEGLQWNVVLLGERADVPQLLARADLFVLPSRFEGLPSVIIEAMASGRAVVATAVAGVPELVEEGVTGWLVPVAQPSLLAAKVLTALDGDLGLVGRAGRRRAETLFSDSAMTDAFTKVYEVAASA